MTRRRLLMCPPEHFELRYAINPWMRGGAPVRRERALAQWQALRIALAHHARVLTIDPDPDLPDMCFTANAGLVAGNAFVPSRFRHAERRGEESLFARWFEENGYRCLRLPDDVVFEGAGDALFDARRRLWIGHGQRTDRAAIQVLRDLLGVDVMPLRLIDERWYRLDTAFCPLANGRLLYYPGAFDAPSQQLIAKEWPVDRRIAVDTTDAALFVCNAISLGTHLLLSGAGKALRARLALAGQHVQFVALDEFHKAGGSARCLSLPLDGPAAADGADDSMASAA